MKEVIEDFLSKRPSVVAAYGYGSGVFKQAGYSKDDKTQLDLILVVDDVKKWHLENIKLNPNDYSFIGRMYFKLSSKEELIGKTGVTYLSNILYKGNEFKYGIVDINFLKEALHTWNSFYLTGRFQKTVLEIKSTDEIRKLILENRRSAIIVALLMTDDEVTMKNLLVELCNLSYAGDTRMKVAENPRKVLNIVEGSYQEYLKIYKSIIEHFASINDDNILVNHDLVLESYESIPVCLKEYLESNRVDIHNPELVKEFIMAYLGELNKNESMYQTLKGLKTNGVVRSVKYALAKVKKRFKK